MDTLLVAKLMKLGQYDELHELFKEQSSSKVLNENFVSYMDYLINSSGFSRSKIVQKAGLSKDYMYKVLRGDKRTTERDYIIAFCMAMNSPLSKLQHALELYPFPILDAQDNRDYLIISAVLGSLSIEKLNDALEATGHVLLRTTPEMPSAKVGPGRSTSSLQKSLNFELGKEISSNPKERFRKMKKIGTKIIAEQIGMAPMDIGVTAECKLQGDDGDIVYVQVSFTPYTSIYMVSKSSLYEDISPEDMIKLESYESLEEASESQFFLDFVELDKLTDQRMEEELKKTNDTRYSPAYIRSGVDFGKDGYTIYVEGYNNNQPERNEYIQIRKTGSNVIYSVSHTSYYLQYMLGDMYEAYYGKPEKQLYVIETESLDNLGEYEGYRESFEALLNLLDETYISDGAEEE